MKFRPSQRSPGPVVLGAGFRWLTVLCTGAGSLSLKICHLYSVRFWLLQVSDVKQRFFAASKLRNFRPKFSAFASHSARLYT